MQGREHARLRSRQDALRGRCPCKERPGRWHAGIGDFGGRLHLVASARRCPVLRLFGRHRRRTFGTLQRPRACPRGSAQNGQHLVIFARALLQSCSKSGVLTPSFGFRRPRPPCAKFLIFLGFACPPGPTARARKRIRDVEAGGSNPLTPTRISSTPRRAGRRVRPIQAAASPAVGASVTAIPPGVERAGSVPLMAQGFPPFRPALPATTSIIGRSSSLITRGAFGLGDRR